MGCRWGTHNPRFTVPRFDVNCTFAQRAAMAAEASDVGCGICEFHNRWGHCGDNRGKVVSRNRGTGYIKNLLDQFIEVSSSHRNRFEPTFLIGAWIAAMKQLCIAENHRQRRAQFMSEPFYAGLLEQLVFARFDCRVLWLSGHLESSRHEKLLSRFYVEYSPHPSSIPSANAKATRPTPPC